MSSFVLDWLLVCGVGASLLGALAWTIDRRFGGAAPRLVSALWWVCVGRLVVPPFVAAPWGLETTVFAPAEGEGVSATSLGTEASGGAFGPFELWIALWLIGATLGMTRYVARLALAHRTWSRVPCTPPTPALQSVYRRVGRTLGVRELPPLRTTDGAGPACVGVVRPWIALPADSSNDGRSEHLECVLLHELSHWKRRDGLQRAVLEILRCAYWFHPVAWVADRRLRVLAEFDCDGRASRVAVGGASSVRAALLRRASYLMGGERIGAAPWLDRQSGLISRLDALERPRPSASALWVASTLVGAVLVVPPLRAVARSEASSTVRLDPMPAVKSRVPAATPPLDELNGCLQKRYAVMAALADQRRQGAPITNP